MQPNRPATASPGQVRAQVTDLHLPGIRVTDRWFVVGRRRFEITELHNLRTVRGSHHPMAVRVGLCALLGVALIGVFIRQLEPVGVAGAAVSVLLLSATALAIAWRSPRSFELWAEYRGMTVQLYYSDDEQHYNAVSRALIRARERAWLDAAPESARYPASAAQQAALYSQIARAA